MSYNAFRKDSEGIDRFALGGWPDMGLLSAEIGNINGQRKQIFDGVNDANKLENVHGKIRRNFNHYINVAVGAIVATRPRTEQGGMWTRSFSRSRSRISCLSMPAFMPQKPPGFDGENRAPILQRKLETEKPNNYNAMPVFQIS